MKKTILAMALVGLFGSPIASQSWAASGLATSGSSALAGLPGDMAPAQNHSAEYRATVSHEWTVQLLENINKLPEMAAQQARARQLGFELEAASQAVYNPELGLSYVNGPEDTYGIELSQTIDWGDKSGNARSQALLTQQIAQLEMKLERSRLLGDSLSALIEQQVRNKELAFARQQLEYAGTQLEIARQRVAAGDISQAELELMSMELAGNSADYAMAEQAALVADIQVMSLLGAESQPFSDFLPLISADGFAAVDMQLPALELAYKQVQLAKSQAEVSRSDNSIDPTISLSAERDGDDNKFGIGVSVPLQVRNSYRDISAAADEAVTVAEQGYLSTERLLKQQHKQFQMSVPRLQERYGDWQQLAFSAGSQAASSLGQQWQLGDISTSDYLQSRRQLSANYLVGLQLETAIYQSWIDWLAVSGQLETFILKLASQPQIQAQTQSGPLAE
ncbi:TolC family protein [Shewanella submarina]|uniref:TolC family protein n=1 Tax=Shewanella submarina TaxID=2016376 RepID=A0ABV7GIH8_9GAMM|nr:TolC family protein [Shewanella submarina]MCL1035688.1 TolC family protein [Shewanella submarina]